MTIDGSSGDEPVETRGDEVEGVAWRPRLPRRRFPWRAMAALVALVAIAGAGWYSFHRIAAPLAEGEVPLIAADPSPIKRRPAEPGGEPVPHQDKLVYETIDPSLQAEVVERLLPPPEEPLPAAEPAAPASSPEPPPVAAEQAVLGVSTGTGEASAIAPAAGPELEPSIASLLAEQPTAPASPPPPPTVEVASAPAGQWLVQVGSFRERAQAEEAWNRLRERHGELLAALQSKIERVDLGGDKGIYHRLQVGPLADRDAAAKLCRGLQAKRVDCLVVKP